MGWDEFVWEKVLEGHAPGGRRGYRGRRNRFVWCIQEPLYFSGWYKTPRYVAVSS